MRLKWRFFYFMKKLLVLAVSIFGTFHLFGQLDKGNFSGNLESTFQYLNDDTLIGATQPPSKGLLNSYMNVFYTHGHFKAGLRFESYLPRIQGYPNNFDGTGIGMRYAGYENKFFDVTVGNFYEQFGTGLTLRIYENRALGYDNMLDGVKVKITPFKGIEVKGVYGYQRLGFIGGRLDYSPGIVRGFDGEIHLNETFTKLADKKLDVTLGGSFASKYQKDDNPDLVLPENVGSYGGRLKLRYSRFTLEGEYVIKEQDPSADNGNIYNYGHATVINAGYSQKGLGILLSAKSVDNMSYRSDRNQQLQNVLINYLPSLNKTHTYNLVSSLYPYATQPTGEIAFQGELLWTIKKDTKLGGKYGTTIGINYSSAYVPMRHTSGVNPADSTGVAYKTTPFDMSDSLLWRDFNVNITKKFTKNFNLAISYFNIVLNNDIATVTKVKGNIYTNTWVVEAGFKFKNKSSLRVEAQYMLVNRVDSLENRVKIGTSGSSATDYGDWATGVLEYTFNSHWYASVMDQYNLGSKKHGSEHHPYLTVGYIRDATRFTASYGRQRAGMFCVGGVCRPVPASNGLTLSITHSF